MTAVNRKAVGGFVFLFAVLAAALFGPAGSRPSCRGTPSTAAG